MDDAEFWEFYARYRGIALRAAKTILKNEAEAEDVCQDIFETLYHMEQDKVNRQTMGAMIREMSVNRAKDYCKKGYRQHEYASSELLENNEAISGCDNVEEIIEALSTKDGLHFIFRKFRKKNKRNYEIYVRVKIYHIPSRIVAEQFHTTENNVNNIVLRTKRWLLKEYQKL